jgi:hypothetical protein
MYLKPVQYPLRTFGEDILLEFLPTWFSMNLASHSDGFHYSSISKKDLSDECIEFIENAEDAGYSQLLIELRWCLIPQLVKR